MERVYGKYLLSYMLARHGGGAGRFEVSEDVFKKARGGGMSLKNAFKTFDLYRFDVSENHIDSK